MKEEESVTRTMELACEAARIHGVVSGIRAIENAIASASEDWLEPHIATRLILSVTTPEVNRLLAEGVRVGVITDEMLKKIRGEG